MVDPGPNCLFSAAKTEGSSQVVLVLKNPPANIGDIRDVGSTPGLGRSPGGGHGNPLQYSCLENPMDIGDWKATVFRVAKRWTRLKRLSMHTCTEMEVPLFDALLFRGVFSFFDGVALRV